MPEPANFTHEVRDTCRDLARSIWRENAGDLQNVRLTGPQDLPGYFVDRFAYLIAREGPGAGTAAITSHQSAWPTTRSQFDEIVANNWMPARSLSGWVPSDADPPEVTQFGSWLREEWSCYVRELDLESGIGELPNVEGTSWAQVAAESVFFPLKPAILGANYFDLLAEPDRRSAERKHGEKAGTDFFLFMLLVHETVHRHQTGEPLLNEIAQAALWLGFVESRDLRCFQFNSETGASCSMEHDLISTCGMLREIPKISADTASAYSTIFGDEFYSIFCRWGMCFDRGLVRYRTYLDGIGRLARGIESRRVGNAAHLPASDIEFVEFVRRV